MVFSIPMDNMLIQRTNSNSQANSLFERRGLLGSRPSSSLFVASAARFLKCKSEASTDGSPLDESFFTGSVNPLA